MCGILGQINRSEKVDAGSFSAMLETLASRGPDQTGVHIEDNLALGHKRLSIIETSEVGKQPFYSQDKKVILIFNGEIYNYKTLRKKLAYRCQTKTDTEVLLNAYLAYGQKATEHIEGMFSYAVFDKRTQLITLARDHFGKKPLYYYLDDNLFCFASEIKALLLNPYLRKRLEISQSSLIKYLFYGYIPSPNSIFTHINKLEPATTFQFDIQQWQIKNKFRYWQLEKIQPVINLSDNDILATTEELFDQAVSKRLMADVPLGLFLSGGVDSTLVASKIAKYAPNSQAFTVRYKDYQKIDESHYAKRVANQLGLNFQAGDFENSLVFDNFVEILDYLDEPMADIAIVPLYFIAKFARDKITVVLSGDGGDELFGGYSKYQAQAFIENHAYLGYFAAIAKRVFSKSSPFYKLFDSYQLSFAARQFIFGSGSFAPNEVAMLLNKQINLDQVFEEALDYAGKCGNLDALNKSMFLDCAIQLPDWYCVKGDRATMAASMEMRCPFLDKALAEFAFSLAGKHKIKSREGKLILKNIASKHVDRDIIYRAKRGFVVPFDHWIKNELKALFAEYLFLDNGYFENTMVQSLFQDHLAGKADNQFKLLRIFNFNYWYEKYI
ncbi:MAG: asparagine synthase (glutamine-hydrolyzing) [Candidatus Parabeggiatoa sp. nov. 3]|nr:MAG: asparagine synthase (glutamine-hydrolyzing) [Gammaproteobacteria bacterium]